MMIDTSTTAFYVRNVAFDASDSSTYVKIDTDSSDPGLTVSEDTFSIYNSSTSVPDFEFYYNTNSSSGYKLYDFEDVFGLGFTSTTPTSPIVDLYNKGFISTQTFAIYVNQDDVYTPSQLTIGGYDETKYFGNIFWTSFASDSEYKVYFNGAQVCTLSDDDGCVQVSIDAKLCVYLCLCCLCLCC